MSTRSLGISEDVANYLLAHNAEHPELTRLRQETATHEHGRMQISPEQGTFLGWLVRLIGARHALEVGVFTGYSSLAVALALPEDGRLIACDVNEEWTKVAQKAWERASVAHKVSLQLRPALQTLDALLSEGRAGTFDFVFLDADKDNYPAYYERSIALLRVGGVLAIDNALWSGRVAEPSDQEPSTVAIRAVNALAAADPRLQTTLIPLGDGLLLATKL